MRKPILFFTGLLFIIPLTTNAEQRFVKLVKEIQPAIVTITTYDKNKKTIGQGSGFFVNKTGDVITNHHVLKGAYSAKVKTYDGKEYPVKFVLAASEEADLVKVSVETPKNAVKFVKVVRTIPEVAEAIIVVGSPMGLDQTVSAGIISAIRDIPTVGKIIQISAPISPGSSGSPVVNVKGQVIGVASFQMIEGQNLNFAVSGEQILNLKRARKSKSLPEWSLCITEKEKNQCLAAYQKGMQLIWAGEYEKAVSYFKKVAPDHTDCAEIQFGLGFAYGKLKRYEDNIKACREAIRIKPDYADAYLLLGIVCVRHLSRWEEAVDAYKQYISLEPNRDTKSSADFGLGFCLHKIGRYQEAIDAYEQAIKRTSESDGEYLPMFYYHIGEAYSELASNNATYKKLILAPERTYSFLDNTSVSELSFVVT
ncbi:MAG: trypsin-like peptidase domain-containing protein, partial [Planctomycetota bacterium]